MRVGKEEGGLIMKCELYIYNKDSGQMQKLAEGSKGAMCQEMSMRSSVRGSKDKRPHFLVYTNTGALVSSTLNGGANPHTWGNDRDARKKGMGRKNIHCGGKVAVV